MWWSLLMAAVSSPASPVPAPPNSAAAGASGANPASPLSPGVPVPDAAPNFQTLPIGQHDALRSAGEGAHEIALLWWLMFGISVAVFIAVVIGLVLALRRAKANEDTLPNNPLAAPQKGNRAIIWLGAIIPAVILTVVFGFTVRALGIISGPPAREEALTVQIIGHQYWWEFRYLNPNDNNAAVTANELHIPAGQRVRLELTSSDVIHSFWVPSLQGKMDTIPGQVNRFWIQADKPGLFRGFCAEFCGAQHANMQLLVRVQPENEFADWMERQRAEAASIEGGTNADAAFIDSARRGRQLFAQRGCTACHTIRGVSAIANLGPDLTHFASRETLGSGIRVNNRGNLSGWIMNAQGIKRGAAMPPSNLSGEELNDLLNYMETLR